MTTSRLKSITLMASISCLVIVAAGYASARAALAGVEQDLRAYVITHAVSGVDLDGRAPPRRIEVSSEVSWPFVVVGSYSVPRDLHFRRHQTIYLVAPWGVHVLRK
ncbi:hypothetical protein ACCQ05_19835 [Xanthomonas sp. NCPPB 3582]|uniref:hypothetical protein n=1 Tax=Xanthomonas sp. NCPPB 3582 TaxID=487557 RepID=UPI0035581763